MCSLMSPRPRRCQTLRLCHTISLFRPPLLSFCHTYGCPAAASDRVVLSSIAVTPTQIDVPACLIAVCATYSHILSAMLPRHVLSAMPA